MTARALSEWPVSWLCMLIVTAQAGRYVSLNTTSDHVYYFVNDLGVNVKDGFVIFDLASTQDAIIRLSRTQALNVDTCDVIFGAVGNTAVAVRENCGGCSSMSMGSVSLDPLSLLTFWMDWRDSSALKVGFGSTVGQSEIFAYSWTQQFDINYVTATSYYGNEGQWIFLIDTPPTFLTPKPDGSTVVTVAENAPISSTVLSMSAEDDESDTVTYYLIGGHSAMLSVQGTDVMLNQQLDFETDNVFLVTIAASDGRHNVTGVFTLSVSDVIDEAPVVTPGSVTSVLEEVTTGTEIVGLFSVHDADQGDVLTYSLEGTHSVYFSINDTTGAITVQQRVDREGGITRLDDLRVKVVDSAGLTSVLNLDLAVDDVNDNRPHFQSDVYAINVTNSTPADTPVVTLNVSDADEGGNGNVTLSMLTSEEGVWLIGADLYVNVSKMAVSVAHAQSSIHYTLAVEASDGASEAMGRMTAVAIVHVQFELSNDHAPVWVTPVPGARGQMPDVSVREDMAVSSTILCLSARDDDIGWWGDVIYLMTSALTDQGRNVSDKFVLDPASGCLKTSSVLDRDPDTGGTAFYTLTFKAVDPGSRSSEATLKVTVAEVNDNAPVLGEAVYLAQLACDVEVGDIIVSLSASDSDYVANLIFNFCAGVSSYFSLNSVTGDVRTLTNVTTMADASSSHVLSVCVSDGGVPEKTSTAAMLVRVDGCSSSDSSMSNSNPGSSGLKTINLILTAVCGVLGASLLLTSTLLCVSRASSASPVKPFTGGGAGISGTVEKWSQRTNVASHQSRGSSSSSSSSDDTLVTDLTESLSCDALQYI